MAYPGEFTRFTVCTAWRNRWAITAPKLELRLKDSSNVETYFASFPAQQPNPMKFGSSARPQDDVDLEADGVKLFDQKPLWIRKVAHPTTTTTNTNGNPTLSSSSLLMPSFGKSVERFQLHCPPVVQPIDVVCWNAYGEIPPNIKTSVADRDPLTNELVMVKKVLGQLLRCSRTHLRVGRCLEWSALEDSSFLGKIQGGSEECPSSNSPPCLTLHHRIFSDSGRVVVKCSQRDRVDLRQGDGCPSHSKPK